jgi:hypothetical protein
MFLLFRLDVFGCGVSSGNQVMENPFSFQEKRGAWRMRLKEKGCGYADCGIGRSKRHIGASNTREQCPVRGRIHPINALSS